MVGKTILAAHAIVEALKNTRHPYRQALDAVFEGRVRVFDIANFAMIRPHDIRDNACVVVGTIQTLRVSNTEDRKVYAPNENMEPHSPPSRPPPQVWSSATAPRTRRAIRASPSPT